MKENELCKGQKNEFCIDCIHLEEIDNYCLLNEISLYNSHVNNCEEKQTEIDDRFDD